LRKLRGDDLHSRLDEDRRKEREKDAKEHTRRFSRHSPLERHVVVTLTSGDKVSADRFSEVFRSPTLQQHFAEKCSVRLVCGEFELSITFPSYGGEVLEINVTPASREEAAECFVRLEQWARNVSVPRWISIWKGSTDCNGLSSSLARIPMSVCPNNNRRYL
jgi:hypothetical protein